MKRILTLGLLSLAFSTEAMNPRSEGKQQNETENRVEVKKGFNSSVILDLFRQPENVYKVRKQHTTPLLPISVLIKLEHHSSSLPEQISLKTLPLIILPKDDPANSSDVPALTYEEKRPVVRDLHMLESFLRGLLGNEVFDGCRCAVKTKRASSMSALWNTNRRIKSVSEFLNLGSKLTDTFETLRISIKRKLTELDNEYHEKVNNNISIIGDINLLSAMNQLLQMSSQKSINKQDWIAVIDAYEKFRQVSDQNIACEQTVNDSFKSWNNLLLGVKKICNGKEDCENLKIAQKHLANAKYETFVADKLNTDCLVQHALGIINALRLINAKKNLADLNLYISTVQTEIPMLEKIASSWPQAQSDFEFFENNLQEALKKLLGTVPDENAQECDSAIWNVTEAMNQVKDLKIVFGSIFEGDEKSVKNIIQTIAARKSELRTEQSIFEKYISELDALKTSMRNKLRDIEDYKYRLNNLICYVDEAVQLPQHYNVQMQISTNSWVVLSNKSSLPVVHYILSGKFSSGKGWKIHYGHVMNQNSNVELKEKGEDQIMLLNLNNQEHVNILINYFSLIQSMIYDDFQSMSKFVECKTPGPTAEFAVASNFPNYNQKNAQEIIFPKKMDK